MFIKNEEFCITNDDFCRWGTSQTQRISTLSALETRCVKMINFAIKARSFAIKTRNCVSRTRNCVWKWWTSQIAVTAPDPTATSAANFTKYCNIKLQYKCRILPIFLLTNAERMENFPWKMMILYWKMAGYFAIRRYCQSVNASVADGCGGNVALSMWVKAMNFVSKARNCVLNTMNFAVLTPRATSFQTVIIITARSSFTLGRSSISRTWPQWSRKDFRTLGVRKSWIFYQKRGTWYQKWGIMHQKRGILY